MNNVRSHIRFKQQILIDPAKGFALILVASACLCMIGLSSCSNAPQISPLVVSDLAPTGKMRVGINFGNVLLTAKDAATGEPRGIAVDLAKELARRLGVPLEIVPFANPGKMAEAVTRDEWDVAFLAVDPQRATDINFSAPYVEIDATYLVPPGSQLRAAKDVDRPGIRIAISKGSAYDLYLSRNLKQAKLVRAPMGTSSFKLFVDDNLDATANLRPVLVDFVEKLPGSRILDGRFSVVGQAVGTPRGREAGARYVREFVEYIKSSGLVAQTIDKNGVRGLTVAAKSAIR